MTKALTTGSTNDIAEIFALKPKVEFEITNPITGKQIGLTLYLRSVNDPAVRPVTRAIENERLKLERTKRNGGFNADQLRANSIEIVCACITGWNWHKDEDGKPGSIGGEQPEFSPATIKKLISIDPVRALVDAELGDETRFFVS